MSELLGELGERRIYRELLEPRYGKRERFGDDCAPLGRDLVVTTDACPAPMVAQLGTTDPYYAGWLLATINLSDLAAAGARPMGLVVNYTLPMNTPVADLDRIMQGVDDCAKEHGAAVLGGDIRDGHEMHLSATAIGRATRRRLATPLRLTTRPLTGRVKGERVGRRGGEAGDALLLVGDPGYLWGAALLHRGHATLDEQAAHTVFEKARRPIAQLEAGRLLAARGLTRAAIDVSDGLFASVRILAAANDLSAVVEPEIDLDPVLVEVCRQAGVSSFQLGQTWGDWCLLVAVRGAQAAQAERLLVDNGIRVRRVGRLEAGAGRGIQVARGRGRETWDGIDQERFSERSWHGDGIDEQIERMQKLTCQEG